MFRLENVSSAGGSNEASSETQRLKLLQTSTQQLLTYHEQLTNGTESAQQAAAIRSILVAVHPDKHGHDQRFDEIARIASALYEVTKRTVGWNRQLGHIGDSLRALQTKYCPPKQINVPPKEAPRAPEPKSTPWGFWNDTSEDDEDQNENKTEWKAPYEVEDFTFDTRLFGKHIFEVACSLEEDIVERLFNEGEPFNDYGGVSPMRFFEIEGIDGVVACVRTSTDEYRDSYAHWKVVKKYKGKHVQDLGTIQDMKDFVVQGGGFDADGRDRGTRIRTSKGFIEFGADSSYDSYYPHCYCRVN